MMYLLAVKVFMPVWLYLLIVAMLFSLVWLSFEIRKAPSAEELWGFDPDSIAPANN
jgi:hypothetical protein